MSIGRFRSTTLFAPRARAVAPSVDRATFVLFALGGRVFAVAVDTVERVLRVPSPSRAESGVELPSETTTIVYADVTHRVSDLASALGVSFTPTPASRVMLLSSRGAPRAVMVDRVLEVATIDAAIVEAAAPAMEQGGRGRSFPGARGVFTRHEEAVIVLDVARLLDEAEATAHVGAAQSPMVLPI